MQAVQAKRAVVATTARERLNLAAAVRAGKRLVAHRKFFVIKRHGNFSQLLYLSKSKKARPTNNCQPGSKLFLREAVSKDLDNLSRPRLTLAD